MKKIIEKSLMLSAIIIATVFAIAWAFFGYTEEIGVVFKLMFLAVLIMVVQRELYALPLKYYLVNMLIEYATISTIVLIYGIIWEWFEQLNWWMAFIYVGIVYVIAYFLNMVIIKKDIDYINDRLKKRREKSENELRK